MALRELCVVLLSSQCLEVKCDIMSTAGAIFSAVMSFINLGELTCFGLAYMKVSGSWVAHSWPGASYNPNIGYLSTILKGTLKFLVVPMQVPSVQVSRVYISLALTLA